MDYIPLIILNNTLSPDDQDGHYNEKVCSMFSAFQERMDDLI